MTLQTLADTCDRLTIRLARPTLNEYELLNVAAVLVLIESSLDRASLQQQVSLPNRVSFDELKSTLSWVQDHRRGTSTTDLREHVSAACGAATTSIHLLQATGSPSLPERRGTRDRPSSPSTPGVRAGRGNGIHRRPVTRGVASLQNRLDTGIIDVAGEQS